MNDDNAQEPFQTNLLKTDGFNHLARARYGYILYNKNDLYIGRSVQLYGEYCHDEATLLKQICRPDDIVVEVGANIGTHTVMLAQTVGELGRVFAFEPQRVVFQTLCANIALNSLINVECFQMAVGAEAGCVLIPDIHYDEESNFGAISVNGFERGFEIPKVTLDEHLKIPRCRLIKIDVEGMEAEVISGAAKTIESLRPALYVENDRPDKSAELIKLLWSMEYKLYWHAPRLYSPDNFANNLDNIFGEIMSWNMIGLPKDRTAELHGFEEITDADDWPKKQMPPNS